MLNKNEQIFLQNYSAEELVEFADRLNDFILGNFAGLQKIKRMQTAFEKYNRQLFKKENPELRKKVKNLHNKLTSWNSEKTLRKQVDGFHKEVANAYSNEGMLSGNIGKRNGISHNAELARDLKYRQPLSMFDDINRIERERRWFDTIENHGLDLR